MLLLLTFTNLLFGANLDAMVGQNVDIAPSAYTYRADRRPDANAPESWLALQHVAGLPLNKQVDLGNPGITHALTGLLWEEIRPVQELELTWPNTAKNQPSPDQLKISALINNGTASSWWNNLDAVTESVKPTVTNHGHTYTYLLGQDTCGLVVSVLGDKVAGLYDVPDVRVLTPDTWKKMDVEVEWGFDKENQSKPYDGHIEAYDGRIGAIEPLANDGRTNITDATSWQSDGQSENRRGIKMSLLYQGTTRWRAIQPYTTQADDVARSIITVWTKSGSFSFNPADLEHGPILVREHGFFVRRTSKVTSASARRYAVTPFFSRMESVVQSDSLKGWGSAATPLVAANPTGETITSLGVTFPAHAVVAHPGQSSDAVVAWKSPIDGSVDIKARGLHGQAGGHGVEAWICRDSTGGRTVLAHYTTTGAFQAGFTTSASDGSLESVPVRKGDRILLVIGNKGNYTACTMVLGFHISGRDSASRETRDWDLGEDVASNILASNPHADRFGEADIWTFGSEMPMTEAGTPPRPPVDLDSPAETAKQFETELAGRNLQTIRERTRAHAEMTWEEAVTATRGADLPPIPAPPAGQEPKMQIDVPDKRLNAQWDLGAWHLVRHCSTNPQTGKLWFNDFPYGILAAETYMVLAVLDDMGSPVAAQDGYDQWTMLPTNEPGPVGLFTDGQGALTNSTGPDGMGGNMDHIHAFGPGSIGWALVQHYLLTGDKEWLRANAKRIESSADWMARQRQVNREMVPGGDRLWCKGLQPALQVTPDSGGLWMQFYEAEAYYWSSISRLATALHDVDPAGANRLKAEAESYRKDLKAAVDRSITLSPVMPVRDGTYHSIVPFACYVRGPATGAWGWDREGSGTHVGPLYWDTVQSAAALVSPAGLLSADDVRVQGWFDVLEDRFLFENANASPRDWFYRGWQYQGGLERQANMYLAADDIPVFLRAFLNCYAVDILPKSGYVFNEHAVHGPPDKIFEEAAFLERFRNLLVMEEGDDLWIARGTPKAWLDSGQRISVKHAPTRFGDLDYEIVSDVANNKITATVAVPSRVSPANILLRFRHPAGSRIRSVIVNGKPWRDFDAGKEVVKLHGLSGVVTVEARY
jgi:hypothetical protein